MSESFGPILIGSEAAPRPGVNPDAICNGSSLQCDGMADDIDLAANDRISTSLPSFFLSLPALPVATVFVLPTL